MTTAQNLFIDALAAKADADPRIRAAWLAGSFGQKKRLTVGATWTLICW